MSARYIQTGDSLDYTPTVPVSSGEVVVQGDLVGVAKLDIPAGKLGALAVSGVFAFPKATGDEAAIGAGLKVYWDAGNGVVTTAANDGADPLTAFPYVGKTIEGATKGATQVRVRLSQ